MFSQMLACHMNEIMRRVRHLTEPTARLLALDTDSTIEPREFHQNSPVILTLPFIIVPWNSFTHRANLDRY